MKTYIWHTEYDYYACMADTIEEAESLVKKIYNLDGNKEMPPPDVTLNPGDCQKVYHANE